MSAFAVYYMLSEIDKSCLLKAKRKKKKKNEETKNVIN